jgi:hypothetical protein
MVAPRRLEFGDFQTPASLANRVADLLRARGLHPRTVVEPTCGLGVFVDAALTRFDDATIVAYDINPEYVRSTAGKAPSGRLTCEVANFFTHDWRATFRELAEPTLVIGNPPWVTASGLGALGGANLPEKSNFQNRRGLDALTGKSNFDVAEWMLLRLLEAARGRDVTVAMLVKTSVARRVLAHLWATGVSTANAEMLRFDAAAYFGVAADACLFLCRLGAPASTDCPVTTIDRPDDVQSSIGWRDGLLLSDPVSYDRHRALLSNFTAPDQMRWRSGVKHDCSAVMELTRERDGQFIAASGERVELEPDYVYPLVKSTDVVRGRTTEGRKWVIVTQQRPGDDTSTIAERAPRTWRYLCAHGDRLDARRSSIYRHRPRFAVFGVGPYTFAPWKVAVSALHKHLAFRVVGPIDGRPAVLDDTCYHLSCASEAEARSMVELLLDEGSRALLESLIFWDAKRPITAEVLQRLDLQRIAHRVRGRDPRAEPTAPAASRRDRPARRAAPE